MNEWIKLGAAALKSYHLPRPIVKLECTNRYIVPGHRTGRLLSDLCPPPPALLPLTQSVRLPIDIPRAQPTILRDAARRPQDPLGLMSDVYTLYVILLSHTVKSATRSEVGHK